MAKIEKVVSTADFEQGSIYVNNGKNYELTTGLRSIDIIPFTSYNKFIVDAYDSSGNPLTFSFAGYDSSGNFVSSGYDIAKGWKENGTLIDLSDSSLSSIVGLRILLKSDSDITPSDLGHCDITCILESDWVIADSYPYIEGVPEPLEVFVEPYPHAIMTQESGEYPAYKHVPEPLEVPVEPYPFGVMIQRENEYPTYDHIKLLDEGAFLSATNLESITIPSSVKEIGAQAFRNTKLKEVTVASDCKYYPTSFPDDCIINFYQ